MYIVKDSVPYIYNSSQNNIDVYLYLIMITEKPRALFYKDIMINKNILRCY